MQGRYERRVGNMSAAVYNLNNRAVDSLAC
jgi:hypothetical protein